MTTRATIEPKIKTTLHQFFHTDAQGYKTIFGSFTHAIEDACQLCAWELRDATERAQEVENRRLYDGDPMDSDEAFK